MLFKVLILSSTFFLSIQSHVFAQLREQHIIDSLQNLVDKNSAQRNNIENLCRISEASFILQYDKGILYGKQALMLAVSIKDLHLQARANLAIGKNYWGKSNYPEALRFFSFALNIYTQQKDYKGMVSTYMHVASTSFAQNQLKSSENYYNKALQITRTRLHDTLLMAGRNGIMQSLAMTYLSMGKFDQQIVILREADELLLKSGLTAERASVFSLLAEAAINQNELEEAISYLKKGYQLAFDGEDFLWCGKICDQMAFVEKLKHNFSVSIDHSRKALTYFKKINEKGHIARTHANIGQTIIESINQKVYLDFPERVNNAISNLEEALKIARPISSWVVLQEYEGSLAEAYVLKKDFKNALQAYKSHRNYLDSLTNQQNQKDFYKELLDLEFKKQQDSLLLIKSLDSVSIKNAEQKAMLKTEHIRQLWLYYILGVLLITSISWVFYQKKKNQLRDLQMVIKAEKINKEKQETELQKKINQLSVVALQSQLNPHFVFNALNSVKLFIEENKKEIASRYLTKIANMIRNMLDATIKETSTLTEEIDLLQLYLEMESMRLKDRLSWTINTDLSLEKEMIQLPSMFLQPIVENSIWHGLMPLEKGGTVKIEFKKIEDGSTLLIKIKDDGIGINEAIRISSKKNMLNRSVGLDIFRQRLIAFAEKHYKKSSLEIIDRKDVSNESGTIVIITIDLI